MMESIKPRKISQTWLRATFLLATLAAPAWSQPSCPAGSSVGANTGVTVDTVASDHSNKKILGGNLVAQTFTVDGSGCKMLNAVTFSIKRNNGTGGAAADLTVEIRNIAAGLPGATILASQTVAFASISTAGYTDVTATLSTPIQISGGSQYALVLYSAATGNKNYFGGVDDGDPYAGGQYCKSTDAGVTWSCAWEAASVVDLKMSLCVSDCAGGCVRGHGYWKNHAQAWPVSSLTLGTVVYNQTDLLAILNAPVLGNGLVSMSHQLIAAKLNVAAGAAEPAGIVAAIASADSMIGALVIPPIGSGFIAPATTGALNTTLDQYNSGTYVGGPLPCPED